MNDCESIREQFSSYLDGDVPGSRMQRISDHLERCRECATEFAGWRSTQVLLHSIGSRKAPDDLGLRLRVALSQETTRSTHARLGRLRIRWENTVRPLALQVSAGLASSILLVGSISLLIGMFATPEPLSAKDQPLGAQSGPRFLYSSLQPASPIGGRGDPVIVEAYIDGKGRVYDYKIVSGSTDAKTRDELNSALLFSVFSPALNFGQPVRGVVILSFSGVSVRG